MRLDESSLLQLYDSAVKAFPRTAMRQYATHTVQVKNLDWVPFKGMKTLFVKGYIQNEGHEYNTIILFKNVNYMIGEHDDNAVRIVASDGLPYNLEKIDENDVALRCNCADFRFRFGYYNHLDKSLFGRKPKKYESRGIRGPANPLELPGLCKHLIKTVKALSEAGIFV